MPFARTKIGSYRDLLFLFLFSFLFFFIPLVFFPSPSCDAVLFFQPVSAAAGAGTPISRVGIFFSLSRISFPLYHPRPQLDVMLLRSTRDGEVGAVLYAVTLSIAIASLVADPRYDARPVSDRRALLRIRDRSKEKVGEGIARRCHIRLTQDSL